MLGNFRTPTRILDVLYGTDAAGLGGGGSEQLTQQDAAGTVGAGDRFGEALSEPFSGGLGDGGSQFFFQGGGGLGGAAEAGDLFGDALS